MMSTFCYGFELSICSLCIDFVFSLSSVILTCIRSSISVLHILGALCLFTILILVLFWLLQFPMCSILICALLYARGRASSKFVGRQSTVDCLYRPSLPFFSTDDAALYLTVVRVPAGVSPSTVCSGNFPAGEWCFQGFDGSHWPRSLFFVWQSGRWETNLFCFVVVFFEFLMFIFGCHWKLLFLPVCSSVLKFSCSFQLFGFSLPVRDHPCTLIAGCFRFGLIAAQEHPGWLLLAPLYAFLISLFDFQFCRQIPWKNRKSSVLFLRFEKTKLNIISLQKIKKTFQRGKNGVLHAKNANIQNENPHGFIPVFATGKTSDGKRYVFW